MFEVVTRRDGDVLVASVHGIVALTTMMAVRGFLATRLIERDARSIVLDLRQADLLLSSLDWMELADSAPYFPPISIVTTPMDESIVEAHCYRAAAVTGHLRMVHTDLARAIAWASARQEHWKLAPAS